MPRTMVESERLTMRELSMDDLPCLQDILASPKVMEFWPAPLTRDEAIAWIEKQQMRYVRDGCGYWLLSLRESGQPVGQAGLILCDIHEDLEPGVGYILDDAHWHKGYATEAARAILDYAFNQRDDAHVIAPIRPNNTPSARVAQRLGMTIRERTFYANFDHDIWQITTADYAARSRSSP